MAVAAASDEAVGTPTTPDATTDPQDVRTVALFPSLSLSVPDPYEWLLLLLLCVCV